MPTLEIEGSTFMVDENTAALVKVLQGLILSIDELAKRVK